MRVLASYQVVLIDDIVPLRNVGLAVIVEPYPEDIEQVSRRCFETGAAIHFPDTLLCSLTGLVVRREKSDVLVTFLFSVAFFLASLEGKPACSPRLPLLGILTSRVCLNLCKLGVEVLVAAHVEGDPAIRLELVVVVGVARVERVTCTAVLPYGRHCSCILEDGGTHFT